jgi:RNA polymerase sigma factor (sigma-70 family)
MTPPRQDVGRLEELLQHADWVHGLAHRLVVDASRADDLVQDTWVVALERGPRHAGNLRAWLGRVVTSLARSTWRSDDRRLRRELQGAREEALPSTEDLVQEAALTRTLADAVLELPEPFRTVLLLRYFRDRTPTQIARELDRPVATVKTQLQRGLHRLRDRLDDEFDGGREGWTTALLPLALAGAPTVGTLSAVAPAVAAAAGVLAIGAVAVRALDAPVEDPTALGFAEALVPPPLRTELPPVEGRADAPLEEEGSASAARHEEEGGGVGLGARSGAGLRPLAGLLLDAELRGLAGQPVRWRDPGRLSWANSERTVISGPRTWLPLLPETRDALERDAAALERFAAENFPRPELAVALFRGEEPPEYTTVTRTGGEFELLVPGTGLELELEDDAFGLLGTAELELERRRRVWIAGPRRRYVGVVTDPVGDPVAGVRVVARPGAPGSVLSSLAEGGDFLPMRHEGVSDRLGEVRFGPGSVALSPAFRVDVLVGDEWVELAVDVGERALGGAADEEVRFAIQLPPVEEPLITLQGRVVLPDGSPAPRAVVVLGGSFAATDAEGRYELDVFSLEGGLRAARAGSGIAAFEDLGLAYAGLAGPQPGPELRLTPGSLSISGRVVDGEGAPLAGARLRLVDDVPVPGKPYSLEDLSGARTLGFVDTDLDGRYELDGLLQHDYRVVVEYGEHTLTSAPIPAGTIGRDLVLERRD